MSIALRHAVDRRSNGLAIATMCVGVLCFVANDAIAKWLTVHYAPIEIVFVRNLLALPIIFAIVYSIVGVAGIRTRRPGVHALRGLLLAGGACTFFLALESVELAEATALFFAAPIFIAALSVPLLGEHVGWRRWSAVIAGFAGVLIVVRPGAAAFEPASLFAVASALLYAVGMLAVRWLDRDESVWTMMLYAVLFPALFTGLIVVPQWQVPELSHLPAFLGMAVFGTLGITLTSHAFRLAPAAIVAPFDYTALIWASLLGWLFWSEIPGMWTYAGATVIIASGIYIVLRETRRAGMSEGSS